MNLNTKVTPLSLALATGLFTASAIAGTSVGVNTKLGYESSSDEVMYDLEVAHKTENSVFRVESIETFNGIQAEMAMTDLIGNFGVLGRVAYHSDDDEEYQDDETETAYELGIMYSIKLDRLQFHPHLSYGSLEETEEGDEPWEVSKSTVGSFNRFDIGESWQIRADTFYNTYDDGEAGEEHDEGEAFELDLAVAYTFKKNHEFVLGANSYKEMNDDSDSEDDLEGWAYAEYHYTF